MDTPGSTPVDETRVNALCKIGEGAERCSFLAVEDRVVYVCQKGTELENLIRSRRETEQMAAKGDNCSGPPNFTPNGV